MSYNKIRAAPDRCTSYSCTPYRLRADLGLPTDHRSQERHDEMNKMPMLNKPNIFNNFVAHNYRTTQPNKCLQLQYS